MCNSTSQTDADHSKSQIDVDRIYGEICLTYRFFAKWRTLVWIANLAVMSALLTLTVKALKDAPNEAWLVPLVGIPFGVCLLLADIRTHQLTYYAIRAGAALEGTPAGFFKTHLDLDDKKLGLVGEKQGRARWFISRLITHSCAAFLFFAGSSAMLAYLAWKL